MDRKVLVACEYTGTVRNAFLDQGFEAVSVDKKPAENRPEHHHQGDILDFLDERGEEFDLMIAHPPCRFLSHSGVRWLYEQENRWQEMIDAAVFFRKLLSTDKISRVAVENSRPHKWAKKVAGIQSYPDEYRQDIQPYMFGHKEQKTIRLWLRNLPKLESTEVMDEREEVVHQMGSIKNRSEERAKFYEGIAEAMANQWGKLL
jgi:hypothetical protein